jgi:hypothetical protein
MVAQGTVNAAPTESVELRFGVVEGATDLFDAKNAIDGIVDFTAPPPPLAAPNSPAGSLPPEAYFRNLSEPRSHLQLLSADMRGIPANAADEIAWTLVIVALDSFLPGTSGWSLTWDASDVDTSVAEVRLTNETDGSTVDMRATTTLPI